MMNIKNLKIWIKDNRGKFLALVIAGIYLLISFFFGDERSFGLMFWYLFLPLGCIFFGEVLGASKGFFGNCYINQETPGCFIVLGGWILLLMPLIMMIWTAVFK